MFGARHWGAMLLAMKSLTMMLMILWTTPRQSAEEWTIKMCKPTGVNFLYFGNSCTRHDLSPFRREKDCSPTTHSYYVNDHVTPLCPQDAYLSFVDEDSLVGPLSLTIDET